MFAVLVILAKTTGNLIAEDEVKRVTKPSAELVERLTKAIRTHCPKAEISVTNEAFIAKHGTMMFTVHGHSMGGAFQQKTHEQEGPNTRGFILEVSLEDGPYGGQAGVPQTLLEPYWRRFIDAPSTDDGKKHHRINFSYGNSLDPKLKQAILDTIPKTKIAKNVP